MDRYQHLATVGEGSYGLVLKCKHKESDQIVAVKKFLETEDDSSVRKMALREIRMLKKLKHENLVAMIDVFRHRKRFYLVFEYVEGTVLDELERHSGGLGTEECRERIFQVARAVHFCHMNNVIHRDIKPENVLVSSLGVVKLCDFGFARLVSIAGENCTEYVATRWYRAPELLVGELNYGAPVDIWAIGCLYAEMMTGDPLFPGESDIDQLYLTMKLLGRPCMKHQQLMVKNKQYVGMIKSAPSEINLQKQFEDWSSTSIAFLKVCMEMDPQQRPTSEEVLKHPLFTQDNFVQRFLPKLRQKVIQEFNDKPLLRKIKGQIIASTDKVYKKEEYAKLRKPSRIETPKWQIHVNECNGKRKLSYDTTNCDNSMTKENSIQSMIKEKISQECQSTPNLRQNPNFATTKKLAEMQLDKTLPSVIKSTPNADTKSASSIKEDTQSCLSHRIPPSPPRFQSLQPTLIDFSTKSPSRLTLQQNILHPNISNICFVQDHLKKSPNILQTIQNTSIKSTFGQIPLLQPPKAQFPKRIDRNTILDLANGTDRLAGGEQPFIPSWLSNNPKPRRREKYKTDDFTLPVVPGATASPNKPNKKPQTSPEELLSQTITPDIRYKKAKRKYVFNDHNPYNSINEKD